MKMKILASAISLLCFSQLSMAEVRTTVTLNNISHTFSYPDQAASDAGLKDFQENPGNYGGFFNNPPNANGAVFTTTNSAGNTYSFVTQQSGGLLITKTVNGVTSMERVTKAATGGSSLVEYANTYAQTDNPANLKVVAINKDDFAKIATATDSVKLATPDATVLAVDTAAIAGSLYAGVQQADFVSANVVLNGVTKTYTFNNMQEAVDATKNPLAYQADFNNATSEVGAVLQYNYKGKTIVLATTEQNTVVAFDGTNYFTFSGQGVKNKLRAYLINGKGTPAKVTDLTKFTTLLTDASTVAGTSTVFKNIVNKVATPAELVTSTITANGTTKVYTFANQVDALYALSHPNKFSADFGGIGSLKGVVIASQSQGQSSNLVFLDASGTQAAVTLDGKNYFLLQGANLSELVNTNLKAYIDSKGENGFLRALNAGEIALVNGYLKLAGLPLINLFDKVVQITNFVNDENQARNNPTAAVAGNPASLMGTMVDSAFDIAAPADTTVPVKNAVAAGDTAMTPTFSVGARYGHYSLAGRSADTVTVPLTAGMKLSPKSQLIFTVPLTYARMNGSDQYQIGGGVAYKYNARDNWVLMPAISYAYRDAGSNNFVYNSDTGNITGSPRIAGHMVSGTLTSKYTWSVNNADPKSFRVSITNMMGYFQSMNLNTNIDGRSYKTSGDVANYVLKNGIAFGKSMDKFNVAAFFYDTQFFGSRLYFDQYDEVGLAVKPENAGKWLDGLSLSANYVFSATRPSGSGSIDGFNVNLGYRY
ncbi:MAG: hypothetical protein RL637_944 [Pseudomonadota bacterium]